MSASPKECEIGIIGLGTMGRNLLLNIAEQGFSAIGLDKDTAKVQLLQKDAASFANVASTHDLNVFLNRLKKPRAILLLVPAGSVTDEVLGEVCPGLAAGDLVIDAGNSFFKDTERREKALSQRGLLYLGMGVSGGELGARRGPSLMPGGNQISYERIRHICESIAAKVKGEPCVTYLGKGASGHYVKMVHNGIEYALMQLIAESYLLMKKALGLSDDQCHEVYDDWNQIELNSYLLEISAKIFLKKDDRTNHRLIDVVLDVARENGTGKWTCQEAMEIQVPVPTIDAAVSARDLSSFEADRRIASKSLVGPKSDIPSKDRQAFLKQMRSAYYASSILSFAQGMALLRKASDKYQYNYSLERVARIWRGGCIIRAGILEPIMSAFQRRSDLPNLILDEHLGGELARNQADLRSVVEMSARLGLAIPGMMASLSYYDGYRSEWLPANLIQAQRDFFGAHTYERVDCKGVFHSNWESQ